VADNYPVNLTSTAASRWSPSGPSETAWTPVG